MDYRRAIFSHMAWIGDFKHRISCGESIDPEEAGRSDRCEIGRWISGRGGEEYGTFAEFQGVREAHDKFHTCVRGALEEAEKGDSRGALKLLDESGLCVGISRDLLDRLQTLFDKTGKQGNEL